ncbi:hypothetical protein L3V82_04935 [Thiotrichales bacterium 19S3-7]|nr:hypothetical protein [Thiotrichales bacterium 19S3-7]
MIIHAVVSEQEKLARRIYFDSFAPYEVVADIPESINFDQTMTGIEWVRKLKENDLTLSEAIYVKQMTEIAKKYGALAIPPGGWDRISSQNYIDHRNRNNESDFILYIAKPETITAQEMADLTAIHSHLTLGHPIIGECHGLQIYHLYHGGQLGVFESGITLVCNEDPTLRLNDGKFQHKPNHCSNNIDTPNASWHLDWNHNTFAYTTEASSLAYEQIETDHPLQSDKLTWTAKPSDIKTSGIHVVRGLNRWLKSYQMEQFKMTFKQQRRTMGGYYLAIEEDDVYLSDGERGDQCYRSAKEKIDHAANWAKLYANVSAMSQAYNDIILTVSMFKGIAFNTVKEEFEGSIFQHIASAYIENLPGKIITHLTDSNAYFTQHHPSKSLTEASAIRDMKLAKQKLNSSCLFYHAECRKALVRDAIQHSRCESLN